MIYKNNYQRKQAVWREKWMKKVEEQQRKKALYQPVIDAGVSLRKAFAGLRNAVSEAVKTVSDGINEIISDPEFIEKLEKYNAGQGNG